MLWIHLGLFSALLLGLYDICKKHALQDNAVLPVLFFATVCGAVVWLPALTMSTFAPAAMHGSGWYVPVLSLSGHLQIFCKAVLVGSSWVLAYFALRHLPITIVGPIRASSPAWVLVGAMVLFGESFTLPQWIGIAVTLAAYWGFSLAGREEGIYFERNRWVFCIVAAALLGAGASLYDKYLLQPADLAPASVQAWFGVYLVLALLPVYLLLGRHGGDFQWRWTIPLIGLALVASDWLYFNALHQSEALIGVLSVIRRGSVVVSFLLGAWFFGEGNLKRKGLALAGILAGLSALVLFD
jgi:transporter family protein